MPGRSDVAHATDPEAMERLKSLVARRSPGVVASGVMRLRFDLVLQIRGRRILEAKLNSSGSIFGLEGPSGSGKSTLLRALAGVSRDASGLIEVDGSCWLSPTAVVPPWQRRVGWMPQDSALFPHLSVEENLQFGTESWRRASVPATPGLQAGTEARRHDPMPSGPSLAEVAEALHLGALLDRRPRHLSGGEKQRVALGRALLSSPQLLLLDEPFSSLDRQLRRRVIDAVSATCRRWNIPAVIVSHDARDLDHMVDVWLEVSEGVLRLKEAP